MKLTPAQIAQLKEFVHVLKAHPELLHEESLSFFADYLRSLGAHLPAKVEDIDEDMPDLGEDEEPEKKEEHKKEEEEEPEPEPEEEEKEEPDPDVIPAESDAPQEMGGDFEVTDEFREKAQELRQEANELVANGNIPDAIAKLTEAITRYNSKSAPLYAHRGQLYLKLKKPLSAIRDGEAAIRINADSALGYRVRGKGKALIGEWEAAVVDLRSANQRDYDPDVNDFLKTVSAKAQVIADKRKKREERQKARQAKSKPKSTGAGAGPGGLPDWIPKNFMQSLMSDPDFLTVMQDPEVLPILTEISKNPANAMKYKDHPKLSKLIGKFAGAFPGKQ